MRNKKNPILKNLIHNRVLLAFFGVALLVFISFPLARNLSKQYKVNEEIKELEKEIEKMEGKNHDLNNLIDYLSSDQFVMEQARLNLNYKKPGEEMVVIKGEESPDLQGEDSRDQNSVYQIKGLENLKPPEKISNPRKWMSYFFD